MNAYYVLGLMLGPGGVEMKVVIPALEDLFT